NHTDCPLTDFGGKTSIFSHPVYLFLRKFSLQDSRGGSFLVVHVVFKSIHAVVACFAAVCRIIFSFRDGLFRFNHS
ncbi:hypothetical protein, partial [Escherichia coli]|uniref:hypothetical protein n=1 Tax=Escherichia coli TaxID=562 RepID=UPI0021BE8D60